MKYTASRQQVIAIKLRMEKFLDLGDFQAFLKAQALYIILDSGSSIEKAASLALKMHLNVKQTQISQKIPPLINLPIRKEGGMKL